MKMSWIIRSLRTMSEFLLDKADCQIIVISVWNILGEVIKIICEVFFGIHFFDVELRRYTENRVLDCKEERKRESELLAIESSLVENNSVGEMDLEKRRFWKKEIKKCEHA